MNRLIEPPSNMKKHIQGLGCGTVHEYFDWCSDNSFVAKLEKSAMQRKKENDKHRDNIFSASLDGGSKKLKDVQSLVPHQHPDEDLVAFFTFLKKKSKLISRKTGDFNRKPYTQGLQCLWYYRNYWIKEYEDWKPKSKNVRRQFTSLVRFLLTDYVIPSFMDQAWFVDPEIRYPNKVNESKNLVYDKTPELEWFLGLCEGKNIRKMDKIPVTLTKKQAHHFSLAPSSYKINEAFRYGQVLGMGGTIRLVEQILNKLDLSYNYPDYANHNYIEVNAFWDPLIRLYINNPMLDVHTFGQLVDYINSQRLGRDAPNPNFSFKHRTADTLLSQSDEWHIMVRKTQGRSFIEWEPSKEISFYSREEGLIGRQNYRVWTIEQLMNSKQLAQEGKAMRHCVRSYTSSCKSGRCTIWSLKNNGERKTTIEVNSNGRIVQALGLANRRANDVEKRIIGDWAGRNDLDSGRAL